MKHKKLTKLKLYAKINMDGFENPMEKLSNFNRIKSNFESTIKEIIFLFI
jgi:hypothetical protein